MGVYGNSLDALNEGLIKKKIESSKRKKFEMMILSKSKSIINKYNKNSGFKIVQYNDKYNDEFYLRNWYYEDECPFENSFTVVTGYWLDLDCYEKYKDMTKREYSNTPEVQKWYDDQGKCLDELNSKLGKYGSFEIDGSYDEFSIYFEPTKEIINSFNDEELINDTKGE